MEAWLIALISGIAVYLIMHFLLKTAKFVFKLAIAAVIALALYYFLKDAVIGLLIR